MYSTEDNNIVELDLFSLISVPTMFIRKVYFLYFSSSERGMVSAHQEYIRSHADV